MSRYYPPQEGRTAEYMKMLRQLHEDRGSSSIREQSLPKQDGKTFADVIIPAYNVEKYVDRCVRSVLGQRTGYPYRIIIVDDGSGDRTGQIIDRYRDAGNVVIVHQENKGLAGARNTGLLQSRSKYILFLDSDDLLAKDAIERLGSACERENADISVGSYGNFRAVPILHKAYPQRAGVLGSELELTGHAWAKLYRRELFERVQFPERYWFEDSLMQQVVFPQAGRIFGIGNMVYLRRINPGSITQNAAGNPKSLDSLWVTLRLMEDRESLGIEKNENYYQYLLNQTRLNHTRLRAMDREIREAAFYVTAERIRQLFPDRNADGGEKETLARAVETADFDLFSRLCGV